MLSRLKKNIGIAIACLAILGVTGPALLAQSTTQGAIGGTVYDPTNAVIANAKVTIQNTATNAVQVLTSDSGGFFKAPLLEPGTYSVIVLSPGFSEYKTTVTVVLGQQTDLMPHLT